MADLNPQQITDLMVLVATHPFDELVFGGYICATCTPECCDDPDNNVGWPCPELTGAGMTSVAATLFVHGFNEGMRVVRSGDLKRAYAELARVREQLAPADGSGR